MNRRILKYIPALLFFCFLLPEVYAQAGKITFDLQKDKPEKFKNKTLKSEKTGEKKFTLPRRFVQNTVSHYNYFFNANNKINSVIERARMANKDDYSKLLPFYSYSLANTASQSSELDSVILKATAGILLHDLRSDWVDNLYLLIGKAYYLRNDFDSAAMTFQFINYNLFPRKKKSEDDQLIVGSSDYASNKGISISSKEDRNLIDKAFTRPPSRNDALVWQIRTYIDMEEFSDAAGLINTLKNDALFPERLNASLEEMQGYWFFKQKMYDSAVTHIEKALPTAIDIADKARREYLLAQLYEMEGRQDTASDYYDKAIRHTTDPLMDIYANLNKAKMLKGNGPDEIAKSINTLLRMAKKDKFELYRDIIFYSAAQLALEIPDTTAAISFYKRSVFFNENNLSFKNKSFLTLAEISYQQKNYKNAYAFYDSLQLPDSTLSDITAIIQKKNALAQIVKHINIIEREDSLQSIAALSVADRDDFLKKLSKKLKKERGVNDEEVAYGNAASTYFDTKNQPQDIFSTNETKGDWYFYNASVKTKGYNEFKRVWGKRQNVDNWRRVSSGDQNLVSNPRERNIQKNTLLTGDIDPLAPADSTNISDSGNELENINFQQDISVEGLLANVPLTKPLMDSSNRKVAISLFQLGKNYQNLLEDYSAAIEAYENSLNRFPDSLYNGELYMNLSYCYNKIGNLAKADFYKNLLLKKFADSKFTQYVLHPERFNPSKKDTAAGRRYDDIYKLFIEGNFDQAIKEKQTADSLYGNNYWSPQLLYIESVYYIREHQDSAAINILNQVLTQYPTSPLREKAATMIDVLSRRDSIENYLTNLQIERAKEDSQVVVFDDTKVSRNVQLPTDNNNIQPTVAPVTPEKAVINPEKKLPPPVSNATFNFDPNVPQNVVIVLNKVDPVYSSEARSAFVRYNREKFNSLNLQIVKDTLDKDRTLLIFSEFLNADAAIAYRERIKKDAASEISWLPADKYSFYIISNTNLELLKENKKLQDYIDLLNEKYPGKF
ncbi:MAG TPA: tetratricopeptide repeat protein [Hanamia sp.]